MFAPLDWLNGDIAHLRQEYRRRNAVRDEGPHCWRTLGPGDAPVRVLVQSPGRGVRAGPAIVYFHGGGWIVGSPETHAMISRALCEATTLKVFSVDYRLAPEHPAPAPVEDGCTVLTDMLSSPEAVMSGVFLCGDSAGGAIALAVERAARERFGPHVLGICSFYGAFGLERTASMRRHASRDHGLDEDCMRRMWTLAHGADTRSPYAIGALAVPAGAPVFLLAAECDPLLDDTLSLADALTSCGRPHDLLVAEGVAHGFLGDLPRSDAAAGVIRRVARWMQRQ